jgi:hypothetical protein
MKISIFCLFAFTLITFVFSRRNEIKDSFTESSQFGLSKWERLSGKLECFERNIDIKFSTLENEMEARFTNVDSMLIERAEIIEFKMEEVERNLKELIQLIKMTRHTEPFKFSNPKRVFSEIVESPKQPPIEERKIKGISGIQNLGL